MGYAHALDGFSRSSIEVRRIKNAKVTATRHRKWQEARLQREEEEKKKAEEVLNMRRRERARLSNYIYTSTRNSDRASNSGSLFRQEYFSTFTRMALSSRASGISHLSKQRAFELHDQETDRTFQEKSIKKDTALDSCSLLSTISAHKPSESVLQARLAGTDGAESPTDSLEDALQERLEHEAATSILIAELTDIKSRLGDCLSKPLTGNDLTAGELREATGGSSVQPVKEGTLLSSHNSNKIADSQKDWKSFGFQSKRMDSVMMPNGNCMLTEKWNLESFGGNLALSNKVQIENRSKSSSTNNDQKCNLDFYRRDETMIRSSNKENTHAIAYVPRKLMAGKAEEPDVNVRPDSKDSANQYDRNLKHVLGDQGTHLSLHKEDFIGSIQCEESTCETFAFKDEQTMLHEFHASSNQLDDVIKFYVPDRKEVFDMHMGLELKPIPEGNSSTVTPLKSTLPPLQKFRDGQRPPFSTLSSQFRNQQTSGSKEPRRIAGRFTGFSDEEKSLLASIERLDVKLAVMSGKISNSSRISNLSAGYHSTRSAPPVMRHKASSDAYSFNSSLFTARPKTTSQTRGLSPISRRRQNVGLTNVPREKTCQFQPCIAEQPKKNKAIPPTTNHAKEMQATDGKILVHQNAEFLFN